MESNQLNAKLYEWHLPQPYCDTSEAIERLYPLKVYNTLTKSKIRFIPQNKDFVTWYQCGPTVYAESHLGHARTYISLDIIKRILRDYFNYPILLCQNITDIDDKIIIRSNENQEAFRDLASRYEIEFLDDMKSLGVELPDMMTRVSEYVQEIIVFIQVIISKGFAYESEGSVYFNVEKFTAAGYHYGKLSPEQIGNQKLVAEGEGALSTGVVKQNAADFALWKRTKDMEKEPAWSSPWGMGRPGWHIECSVMATEAFKSLGVTNIDIHAGGVDLKFPHHDNEIAQSEAYHSSHRWVNYWLHTGHLHIDGSKMSKSLKNFTSIREALKQYTPRQFRLLFLLHKYNSPMDYTEGAVRQAMDIDKIVSEFFQNVKVDLRTLGHVGKTRQHIEESDGAMFQAITKARKEIHEALADDFDTPEAMKSLIELIREYNKKSKTSTGLSSITINSVWKTVLSILRVFGMSQFYDASYEGGSSASAGDGLLTSSGTAGEGGGVTSMMDKEQLLTPILNELIEFRQSIRKTAKTLLKTPESKTAGVDLLNKTDGVRSSFLPFGIRIEDKDEETSIWKLVDPLELEKELKQKQLEEEMKKEQREKKLAKEKERLEQSKIPPEKLFVHLTDQYSEFDVNGIPTKDNKGEPLSNAAIKKLKKQFADQEKLHQKYLESLTAGNNVSGRVVEDKNEGEETKDA